MDRIVVFERRSVGTVLKGSCASEVQYLEIGYSGR